MPPDLANLNNEAIAHAEVGLWKDAHHLAQQAAALNATTGNPTVRLNVGIITTIAEGRAAAMLPNTLLPYVFYGDYAAATAYMAGHPVEALFLPPDQNPLIVGTPAEGWAAAMLARIQSETLPALIFRPDLAGAYFVRGWAGYLQNPESVQARADLQQAAVLSPTETLFLQSVAYLNIGSADSASATAELEAIGRTIAEYWRTNGPDTTYQMMVERLRGDYARVKIAPLALGSSLVFCGATATTGAC
ncbi:MAG: hypothetical protein HC876_00775 [Chloroflexaceae bacterium]|nr:hypothetical protein [Chloroflexaceae bacterium]